jgi:hypothetical protein
MLTNPVKSKETVCLVAGNDISGYSTESSRSRTSNTEDNTTYGKNAIVKDPTLLDGAFTISGKYDSDTEAGPRAVLDPLVGTKVEIIYRPEGTGAGLPQDRFDAVITDYTETAPVAGYRTFALTTEPSDEWDTTAQS